MSALVRVVLQFPRVLWQQVYSRARLEAREVRWICLSFLPAVTCSAMGLATVPEEMEITICEAEHLQKENTLRWARPPLLPSMRKGSACPLVPRVPDRGWGEVMRESLGDPRCTEGWQCWAPPDRELPMHWVGVSAWVLLVPNQEQWRFLQMGKRKPASPIGLSIIRREVILSRPGTVLHCCT